MGIRHSYTMNKKHNSICPCEGHLKDLSSNYELEAIYIAVSPEGSILSGM